VKRSTPRAASTLARDGNPAGAPATIPLDLVGLPASQRDGRLRAAISALIDTARRHGARAIVIEDLDFADARAQGRERAGNRPSRGRRGRGFRQLVAGIPTGKFRDRLTQMAANAGISVIAVDPAYTSRWGAEHWLAPLRQQASPVPPTGHHAAAVVIGRRALGYRARRRAGVTGSGQRTSRRGTAPEHPQPTRAPGTAGPTAATTMAQDRDGPAATPARPGDSRPFGAAGQPGPPPASSIGTVSYGILVAPLIIAGIGISMCFPTVANAVTASVPAGDVGVAAGTNNALNALGGVFGVAIMAAVFAAHGNYSSSASFITGFRPAEAVAAAVAGAGVIAAALAPSKRQHANPAIPASPLLREVPAHDAEPVP
jgi:IS605 OrfB family transposase